MTDRSNTYIDRMVAAQEMAKELRAAGGYRLEIDIGTGAVYLWHGTSKANAQQILMSRKFLEDGYFSHARNHAAFGSMGAAGYGSIRGGRGGGLVMRIKADPRDVHFNQGTGEISNDKELIKGDDGVWATRQHVILYRKNPWGWRHGDIGDYTGTGTPIAWRALEFEYKELGNEDVREGLAKFLKMPADTSFDTLLAEFRKRYGDAHGIWLTRTKKAGKRLYGEYGEGRRIWFEEKDVIDDLGEDGTYVLLPNKNPRLIFDPDSTRSSWEPPNIIIGTYGSKGSEEKAHELYQITGHEIGHARLKHSGFAINSWMYFLKEVKAWDWALTKSKARDYDPKFVAYCLDSYLNGLGENATIRAIYMIEKLLAKHFGKEIAHDTLFPKGTWRRRTNPRLYLSWLPESMNSTQYRPKGDFNKPEIFVGRHKGKLVPWWISHEMGHHYLGHKPSGTQAERIEKEFEAWEWALNKAQQKSVDVWVMIVPMLNYITSIEDGDIAGRVCETLWQFIQKYREKLVNLPPVEAYWIFCNSAAYRYRKTGEKLKMGDIPGEYKRRGNK